MGEGKPTSRSAFDIEAAFKLPRQHRYFNISVLWIFYYTKVVRILHRTGIRHEAVTLLSLASGIVGGVMLLRPGYVHLFFAAFFVHLKDVLDASDGALARVRGQTNRIARFLDSLCDMLAVTWLLAALSVRVFPLLGLSTIAVLALGWISVFIQCSYFNFYLVSYVELFKGTNVRKDERLTDEDSNVYSVKWKRRLLLFLQKMYGYAYGWQDRIIIRLDRISLERITGKSSEDLLPDEKAAWYGNKRLMTLNSPLCFGTHLFVFILAALVSRPVYFYYVVIFIGNAFLIFNIYYRELMLGRIFHKQMRNGFQRGVSS